MPDVLPGQTTLAVLRSLVAAETDQPDPNDFTNVTVDVYDSFINRSLRELIGLLVDEFQDYYVNPDTGNPYAFLTVAQQYLYPLPNDFFKLLGVDALWTPGNIQTAVTLRPFMNNERNAFQGLGVAPGGLWVPRYKISGNQLWLQPMPPTGGLQILVRYVPMLPDLVGRGTIDCTNVGIGDQVNIAVVSNINTKLDDTDYTTLTGGTDFVIGATPAETAANLAAAIPLLVTGFAPPGNGQGSLTATVTSSGSVVTIQLNQPRAIAWFSSRQGHPGVSDGAFVFRPYPIPTQYNPGAPSIVGASACWTNWCSVLNGFDELVVVDAALKVKQKQSQAEDVIILGKRKAELLQRLRTEANNRNAGQNARITNVRRQGLYGYGYPYGGR